MVKTPKKNKKDTCIDEDEDNKEAMIITSKLQHVLAAKSRRLQYKSSPVVKNHVSLSHLSSPDNSFSRASVPFSWEEEPGKPKHHLRHPSYSKCLDLPPKMLLPGEFTKMHLTANHRRRLFGWKRWFRWKKERDGEGYVVGKGSFVYSSEDEDEDEDDMKTTRTGGLHCFSYITRCYFWEVSWKNNKLKIDLFYKYEGKTSSFTCTEYYRVMGFYEPNILAPIP